MKHLLSLAVFVPAAVSAQTKTHDFGGAHPIHAESWMSPKDYPTTAAYKAGGEVDVRFDITAAGQVRNCVVTKSSGDAAIDKVPCARLEKVAEFSPALDPAGNPTATKGWWQITF